MMRVSLSVAAASMLLLLPNLAQAQEDEADCPPGGWFCEEAEPTEGEPTEVEPQQDPEGAGTEKTSPPVVVYKPEEGSGSRRIIIVDAPEDPPPARRRRYQREWGFNLRLESALMGDDANKHPDAGMGGLGFSFRYRPIPHFAFDVGVDFLGGTDWAGNERRETALLMNAMIFFNPKDKLQFYTLGGLGFSGANVLKKTETTDADGNPVVEETDEEYSYFGGQLGIGLEWRVARKTALNFDLVGFIRGRTDEQARHEPEFTDPETGRRTNTSGGGLARLGITFYW
jgi:hypothetical protein